MDPCRHSGRGGAFRARRGIPVWIPPRAEGPPGPGKLQFPACSATGAPVCESYGARERVGLKWSFSSMETGSPAAGQSHSRTDGQWGEAAGLRAGEPGMEVWGPWGSWRLTKGDPHLSPPSSSPP